MLARPLSQASTCFLSLCSQIWYDCLHNLLLFFAPFTGTFRLMLFLLCISRRPNSSLLQNNAFETRFTYTRENTHTTSSDSTRHKDLTHWVSKEFELGTLELEAAVHQLSKRPNVIVYALDPLYFRSIFVTVSRCYQHSGKSIFSRESLSSAFTIYFAYFSKHGERTC